MPDAPDIASVNNSGQNRFFLCPQQINSYATLHWIFSNPIRMPKLKKKQDGCFNQNNFLSPDNNHRTILILFQNSSFNRNFSDVYRVQTLSLSWKICKSRNNPKNRLSGSGVFKFHESCWQNEQRSKGSMRGGQGGGVILSPFHPLPSPPAPLPPFLERRALTAANSPGPPLSLWASRPGPHPPLNLSDPPLIYRVVKRYFIMRGWLLPLPSPYPHPAPYLPPPAPYVPLPLTLHPHICILYTKAEPWIELAKMCLCQITEAYTRYCCQLHHRPDPTCAHQWRKFFGLSIIMSFLS